MEVEEVVRRGNSESGQTWRREGYTAEGVVSQDRGKGERRGNKQREL